ncbi:MerR family transcriptional regulator [Saxibacter everestensis]|uniref:MerR family transcriptional regulator n=1 Tax=Saxibacter everestensis TaxID=2909229 RepID=A0ABY8QTA1_9MICO|nr:MerR family transcriptional regulator [Brevibacteriaceae bacterium ZFBP1038]
MTKDGMTENLRDRTTMHIGEVAERTGLSLRTIRHYDEIGLLPASARTDGGFRVYTSSDLNRLMVIRRMKPLGFTLDQMAELLNLVDRLAVAEAEPAARARLGEYIAMAEEKRDELELNLARADEFITVLRSR